MLVRKEYCGWIDGWIGGEVAEYQFILTDKAQKYLITKKEDNIVLLVNFLFSVPYTQAAAISNLFNKFFTFPVGSPYP